MLFIFLVVSFLFFIYFKLCRSVENRLLTWLFYIASVIFGVFSMNFYMESDETLYLGIISLFIFVMTLYLMSMKINKE